MKKFNLSALAFWAIPIPFLFLSLNSGANPEKPASPLLKAKHGEYGCQHLLDVVSRNVGPESQSPSEIDFLGFLDRKTNQLIAVSAHAGTPTQEEELQRQISDRIQKNKIFSQSELTQKYPRLASVFEHFRSASSSRDLLLTDLQELQYAVQLEIRKELSTQKGLDPTRHPASPEREPAYIAGLKNLESALKEIDLGKCMVYLNPVQASRARLCYQQKLNPKPSSAASSIKKVGSAFRTIGATFGLIAGSHALQNGDPRALQLFELAQFASGEGSHSTELKFSLKEFEQKCFDEVQSLPGDEVDSANRTISQVHQDRNSAPPSSSPGSLSPASAPQSKAAP